MIMFEDNNYSIDRFVCEHPFITWMIVGKAIDGVVKIATYLGYIHGYNRYVKAGFPNCGKPALSSDWREFVNRNTAGYNVYEVGDDDEEETETSEEEEE